MGKIVSTLALIIMLLLFPPAVLITISQNAIPGEKMYPLKRKLEDIVLDIASYNPTTKAYFALAQSQRRFEETQALLARGDIAGANLQELVTQTSTALSDIKKVENNTSKEQLISKLTDSVDEYNKGLERSERLISSNSETQTVASSPVLSPKPNSDHTVTEPKASPVASPSPGQETPRSQDEEKLRKAREELQKIKDELEQEKKQLQSSPAPEPSPSPNSIKSPSPTPQPSASQFQEHSSQKSPSPKPSNKSNNHHG